MPTYVGTLGADNINNAVSDVIYGLDGNDTIFSSFGGIVHIYGGQGEDTIDYSDVAAGSAKIYGDDGADIIDGGANNDEIYGGEDGDQITGWMGDDYIDGGRGNDQLYGNDGFDTIYGGDGADIIHGGAGEDIIDGGYGNDWLDGGSGADIMIGGVGSDTFYVDHAGDYVEDSGMAGSGNDLVIASVSFSLIDPDRASGRIEMLTLDGTADINGTGNEIDNIIKGNSGANILNGRGGADKMTGGAGDDRFYVDNASDVVIEAAGEGNDTVYTSVSYQLAAGEHIETFATTSLTGTSAINMIGNEVAQRINGNNGNNLIYGGGGDDVLVGYAGNDNLEGQAGNDRLYGMSGADNFVFRYATMATAGADTIVDFDANDLIFVDHPTYAGPLGDASFRAGTDALDADDRFIWHAPSKSLYFDADGNGAAPKVLMAVLENGYALSADDIMLF